MIIKNDQYQLTGSSSVTMRNSIISLQLGSPLILSLGVINAQTSTQDLVLSGQVIIKLFKLIY